jgi:hypothetical protein
VLIAAAGGGRLRVHVLLLTITAEMGTKQLLISAVSLACCVQQPGNLGTATWQGQQAGWLFALTAVCA